MHIPEQYGAAEELERYLGDPQDGRNGFSFAQAVALDEGEEYPEQACALLDAWGLPDFYVPVQWGGRLRSYEELISLLRVVARRDFTVGFAYSILSLLGSAATWAGGTDRQKQKVAQLLKGRQQIILAYNEKAHGGDFLATDVKAVRVAGGYQLSGEKWLIGNAVRCVALTVIARTRDEAGPRSLSLFLVDKRALDPSSFEHLPRIKTLGVRGAHVSGIRFKESFVDDDSLIGREGSALEQTLKAFQLTRIIIPALALGAADTALRSTLDFARTRALYGTRVAALPQARRTLVEAFLDLLIGDCLTTACARAMHQTPEQMRLYSAVVKYYVPQSLEETIERLGVVLGARHYLREGHWHGIFQKLLRDNVVVRYHFNAALNLTTIGVHLRDLAQHRAHTASQTNDAISAELPARLASIFDLQHPLADFNPDGLSLYTRGRDDILNGLDLALSQLRLLSPHTPDADPLLQCLIAQTGRVLAQRQAADDEHRALAAQLGNNYSRAPEMFEQAERYCLLEAAACCVHLWLHNRETLGEFFERGDWLVLSLERLLVRLGERRRVLPAEHEERVAEELERLYEDERLFSVVPLQLASHN
ncbi:MAG TPA: acyl-CoA dehydrogenase family protein [Pyrinomonadaceae bacterium]|jgi:alkylation response protein AidB-like acyl-CoA dehydrogenase